MILGPSVATIYYSFTDWNGIGEAELHRTAELPRSRRRPRTTTTALLHVVIWTAFFLTVPIAMALLGVVPALPDQPIPAALPADLLHPVHHRQRR